MRIGSLFAGIGGLELGLERAGVGHTVWQVEKDPYCRQVLARHWPDATRYEDVTTVDWSTVEPVEVLCGGFPCQPFSTAGLRRGVFDERWGWPWFADAVRVVRPRYVVVENVAALLRDVVAFGCVLGDLHQLGFDADWSIVSACAVGAPHTRERVFVVAHSPSRRRSGVGDATTRPEEQPQRQADSELEGRDQGGHWSAVPQPRVLGVAHGLQTASDRHRLRAIGNAVVPQVAEVVGRRIIELDGYRETR